MKMVRHPKEILYSESFNLLKTNVPKVSIWDVADVDPPDFKNAFPFIRSPYGTATRIIDLEASFQIFHCKFS
jgi:hypothetical protein